MKKCLSCINLSFCLSYHETLNDICLFYKAKPAKLKPKAEIKISELYAVRNKITTQYVRSRYTHDILLFSSMQDAVRWLAGTKIRNCEVVRFRR